MQIEDFLSWEARQETRFEFDGFEPVAMVGGSENHARLQRNLAISVGGRLRGTRCEFLGSDLKLVTATQVRYPDGQVVCGGARGEATFTTMPVVLFEVTSPGTRGVDYGAKADEYCALASVRRYVIFEQSRVEALMFVRTGDGWSSRPLGPHDNLLLDEIGIEVPMRELYEGVPIGP